MFCSVGNAGKWTIEIAYHYSIEVTIPNSANNDINYEITMPDLISNCLHVSECCFFRELLIAQCVVIASLLRKGSGDRSKNSNSAIIKERRKQKKNRPQLPTN